MMGQAKNRGTREQRVEEAVLRKRAERMFRGTATGRISGREPQFKELPRVEVHPVHPFQEEMTGDYAALEKRVIGLGELDLDRRYEVAYGNPQKLGDVVSPPIRLAHVGLQGRGLLALAALAASGLIGVRAGADVIIIDEKSELKGLPNAD